MRSSGRENTQRFYVAFDRRQFIKRKKKPKSTRFQSLVYAIVLLFR
jgi:hypothetical protein